MPKPRPLGNKAKDQAGIAIDLLVQAGRLLDRAPATNDRDPDLAMEFVSTANLYVSKAENLMRRLRDGEFTD